MYDRLSLERVDLDANSGPVLKSRNLNAASRFVGLPTNENGCDASDDYQYPLRGFVPRWRFFLCIGMVISAFVFLDRLRDRWWGLFLYFCLFWGGILLGLAPWGKANSRGQHYCGDKGWFHFFVIVPQEHLLTSTNYWGTLISIRDRPMANILSTDKQAGIIGALAEGSSIRSIERQTDVHRDTVMRLRVRIGGDCANIVSSPMMAVRA